MAPDVLSVAVAKLPRCYGFRQPQYVGVVLAGLREPAGPWGPGRPVEARDAFEALPEEEKLRRAAAVHIACDVELYGMEPGPAEPDPRGGQP